MAAAVLEAFPRRPLQLARDPARAQRRLLWLVVALLAFAPAVWWGLGLWRDNGLRHDLRERGVSASVIDSQGECFSRRTISGDEPRGCNLTITYEVAKEHGGGVRTADVHLPGEPTVLAPQALYDPADPDRVMLLREIERGTTGSDWIAMTVLTLLPAIGLLTWFATGRGALAKAAAEPRPVVVAIDRVERGPNRIDIWFHRPNGDGQPLLRSFRNGARPLLVAPPGGATDRNQALALLGPRDHPILLDADLGELELTDQERAAIVRAASTG